MGSMIDRLGTNELAVKRTLNFPSQRSAVRDSGFAAVLAQAQRQGDKRTTATGSVATTPAGSATSATLSTSAQQASAMSAVLYENELNSLFASTILGGSSDSSVLGDSSSNSTGGFFDPSSLTSALGLDSTSGSSLAGLNMGGSANGMVSGDSSSELALELTADMTGGLGLPSIGQSTPLGDIIPGSQAPSGLLSDLTLSTSGSTGAGLAQSAQNGASTSALTGLSSRSSIAPLIQQLAPAYGLSPQLVDAVVQQESGFSPTATSSAGAIGLMQLMPATAAALGVKNPYDPLENLKGGMTYLRQMLDRYHGNVELALAAYNAGSGAVDSYNGIPPYPETQRYVSSIMQQLSSAQAPA